MKYTCVDCGKIVSKGYVMTSKKFNEPIVCRVCYVKRLAKPVIVIAMLAITIACASPEELAKRNKPSPHVFKNAPRLDMSTNGPNTYRVENDETICYIVHYDGAAIWCHWKTDENNSKN